MCYVPATPCATSLRLLIPLKHGASVNRRHRDRIPNTGYDPESPMDAALHGFGQTVGSFVTTECDWRWPVSGNVRDERLAVDIFKSPDPFATVQKRKTDGGMALSVEGIRVISEQPKRKPNLATLRLCEKPPRTASLQYNTGSVPQRYQYPPSPKPPITPVLSSPCPSSLRVKPPRARAAGAVGTGHLVVASNAMSLHHSCPCILPGPPKSAMTTARCV
jgi:hypothetical protein